MVFLSHVAEMMSPGPRKTPEVDFKSPGGVSAIANLLLMKCGENINTPSQKLIKKLSMGSSEDETDSDNEISRIGALKKVRAKDSGGRSRRVLQPSKSAPEGCNLFKFCFLCKIVYIE